VYTKLRTHCPGIKQNVTISNLGLTGMTQRPPLTDPIATALARLFADQTERRDPSHWDIGQKINVAKLSTADPGQQTEKPVGKFKRVSGTLSWAISNDMAAGQTLVDLLTTLVRGSGGFRPQSPNYCGEDPINNLVAAFDTEGWELGLDGVLRPKVLDDLTGIELTAALRSYAERARRGALDNPLLTGTAKDFLEATAKHVLVEKTGQTPNFDNFPTVLAQAFMAVGFAIPNVPTSRAPEAQRVEVAAYELACALNGLRNKQGTGHGRPWASTVTEHQARFAIESMGNIASMMLAALP
jgi:hypothetical protein